MVSRVLGKADIGVGSTPKHHIDPRRGKANGGIEVRRPDLEGDKSCSGA